jgi:peptidoglycan/LPS O-acetylase OafA/YrhL
MKFRPDIEGLRAIAVLLVVLYHCGVDVFGGGYLGVDVFFVLSGFLITSLMLAEIESTQRLSFGAFYGRRARRLLPAATMVIAATVVAGWFVLNPLSRRDLIGDAVSATTYTVNWRFATQSTDYFQAELAPSALQHYWSLAVEEQFYVIWPAIVWLLAGRRLRRARLVAGLGLLIAASFVVCVVVTGRSQPWAFFGLHTRLWQLGAGALGAVLWPHIDRVSPRVRRVAPYAGLAGVIGAAVVFDHTTEWPGTAALVPTIGALAVLVGMPDGAIARVLGTPPMVWIGARSYSWYLWHWPSLILVTAWRDRPLSTGASLLVAGASLLIGHVGYVIVEQPIRHRRSLVRSAPRSVAVGLSLSAACLAGLLVLRPAAQHVDAEGAEAGSVGVPIDSAELSAVLERSAETETVPANLTPSLSDARGDLPAVYELGCHADIPVTEPKVCELGDPSGGVTAVLIGDSHAAQWTPALDALAAGAGIRFLPITKSGCAAFDVPVFNSMLNREYTECDDWRANVLDLVASIRPDIVITTQSSLFTPAETDPAEADGVILDGYIATLEGLAGSADSLVVLSDTPYPAGDVPDCLSGHLDDASACTASRQSALSHRRTAVEIDAASRSGAQYVAVEDLVCGPTRCPVIVGDLLVYRDNSHLSTPYVEWLAPALAARLGGQWVDPQAQR